MDDEARWSHILEAWSARGLDRRDFVKWLGAGGALAAAGCEPGGDGGADAAGEDAREPPWVKDPEPFVRHPTNLETRLESLQGYITPNELFFVRNHAPTPRIDPSTWRLRVGGDAVSEPAELTYDELLALPSRSVIAYLECAGNWRSFHQEVYGRTAEGGPWGRGAVGCAEWTGTPLRSVLAAAGVEPGEFDEDMSVNLVGLDDGEFQRPMPLARAWEEDTLLAWAMNGSLLPPDHGFPVRAVVPGWVASSSVKWLGRIDVSREKHWVKTNTTSYVLKGEAWPPERYAPAEGAPVDEQSIKSALALPRPAELPAGLHRLRGYAHSPHGPVARVEWSADGGTSWREARVLPPRLEHGWTRFELEWDAAPGSWVLMTRATDEAGVTQPLEKPFNQKGYLLNVPIPHPVEVV